VDDRDHDPKVIPEIGVSAIRTQGTVIAALPLGVAAVVLASLLTVRRPACSWRALQRWDVVLCPAS
jgi:hypothetical protein